MTDPNTQPPSYQPPAYPAQTPSYPNTYGAPNAPVPGKTLGIVALVLAIVPVGLQLVGLILGIVALVQSKKAGAKNGIALAAIIVSSVLLVLTIIGIIVAVSLFAAADVGGLLSQVEMCLDNGGTGTVEWQGVTMSCEELLSENGY